ncbi:prohibitin-1-like [Phoenix dactylifera]|uniref:Prohibitin n=1 Tax=Phoenix dactylifera TaxID=42345 RepID=A0A8B9AL05_PHODC|nr:prohibitin-1-like [Phoenix dactylifera]
MDMVGCEEIIIYTAFIRMVVHATNQSLRCLWWCTKFFTFSVLLSSSLLPSFARSPSARPRVSQSHFARLPVATRRPLHRHSAEERDEGSGRRRRRRHGVTASLLLLGPPPFPASRWQVLFRYFPVKTSFYLEGTHLIIPWFERPIIYDVRARPHLVESTSGGRDLQMSKILSLREESSQSGMQLTSEEMSRQAFEKRKRYILGFGVGPKPSSSSSTPSRVSQGHVGELQKLKAEMEEMKMEREELRRQLEQERREREEERKEREEEQKQIAQIF